MEAYSVLMSVYAKVNSEDLKLSITSMLNQTVRPEQFILVWDGPVGDELKDVVSQFENDNPGVFSIIQLPENRGLAYALNVGIDLSRNELIARMDSDDYSMPNRCEEQLAVFSNRPGLVLLGTNTQHFVDDPMLPLESYGINPIGIEEIKKKIRRNSAFSHPTVMFKKSIIMKVGGYDPELRRSQDHDLFCRLVAEGYDVDNINKALVRFRSDNSMMLRNRNEDSCKARIEIQKRLLRRKQCSIIDYLYIRIMVFLMRTVPEAMYINIYSWLKGK